MKQKRFETMPGNPRRRGGFTLVEVIMILMIMAIVATIAADVIAETEANSKADRAAWEVSSALLYARSMAITYGGNYGVEFDTVNNRFQVFQTTGSNVVRQTLFGGGTYVVNMSRTELAGTTMTPAITGDSTNPYDVVYAPLGTTANYGTVVFTFAGKRRTLTIPKLGDPTIN